MSGGERVLLVTGGSRGIGAAVARRGARAGYRVAVNYVANAAAARDLVAEIGRDGGEAEMFAADMGDAASIPRLFEAVDRRFGRLDALVNNAGIVGRKARLDECDLERLTRMFAVNTIGTMVCCQEGVRRMSTRHGGAGGVIVNISSMAAVIGSGGLYVDYAASKGAVDTLTLGLAREVAAEGIRVTGVRPGIVATDIHASRGEPDWPAEMRAQIPVGREGTPDEIAAAVLWLLSDEASYATGAILNVSGGR
jgi:NAD(P)-dependent dehydrogenase (short-subunit alcohol dehydrogenase family)